jgi:hypothetical protein
MECTTNNHRPQGPDKSGASGEAPLNITLFILALIFFTAPFLFTTDGAAVRSVLPAFSRLPESRCLMLALTGYRCPACGMTRSFIYLSRLDLVRAAAMNPAGLPLYALCAYELPYRAVRFLRGNKMRGIKALRRIEFILLAAFFIIDIAYFAVQFF